MHIAVLTDGIMPYVIGGMQRHSFYLVKHLLKQGIDITLVHCVAHGNSIPEEDELRELLDVDSVNLRVIGLEFPNLGKMPGHYLKESYAYSCLIYEKLKNEWGHFDFIYAKGFTAWCLLEKKQKGIHMAPVGVKFHGYEMYQKAKTIRERLEQFMLKPPVVFNNRGANLIFSYGGGITEIIERIGVDPKRIVEIPSGIDDSWLDSNEISTHGIRKFVFVGRSEARKGISELKKAAEKYSHQEAEFHWVGPISSKDKSSKPNHFYHGEIKNELKLKEVLDNSDILILPSKSEGMPNVILEAMSRNCAILATDVGAVRQMITKNNGVLIKPTESDLSKGIDFFINMADSKLSEMKRESWKIIQDQFLWSKIAEQTIYEIERSTNSMRNVTS